MPEMGVIKVHVFGEVLKAVNFDYDDLHVYYQLDLSDSKPIDHSKSSSILMFTSDFLKIGMWTAHFQ